MPADARSLYMTEEEIAAEIGIGVDKWRAIARELERHGLPRGDPLVCNRRFWPAVEAFFYQRHGLAVSSRRLSPKGEMHLDRV